MRGRMLRPHVDDQFVGVEKGGFWHFAAFSYQLSARVTCLRLLLIILFNS